ncbi:ATP-dependent Clp protease proteolytic subunit [Methylobacterium sp. WL19]|uniref:ATP-dependent Clp protease proteolytic subunit n=1 Tax=Methylobacterium sp. WL19 TaxID=2603896 RepID=UPI001650B3FF|nr:ATP-dependent Clp protease proteolytic subunit [Methylobacterium sp. WL19]
MITGRRIVEEADGRVRVDYAAPPKPEPIPMLRDGVVRIEGSIRGFGDCSAASLRQALKDWPAGEPIVVEIDSDGGHIGEAVAMHLALRNDPRPVTVRIFGQASSAAGLVAMAADRIEIAVSGRFAIHYSRYESVGTATATRLRAMADLLDETDAQIVDLLVPRCRCSRGWLLQALVSERKFTGHEAVEVGFADAVIPNR